MVSYMYVCVFVQYSLFVTCIVYTYEHTYLHTCVIFFFMVTSFYFPYTYICVWIDVDV